jgi:hypothetical protein
MRNKRANDAQINPGRIQGSPLALWTYIAQMWREKVVFYSYRVPVHLLACQQDQLLLRCSEMPWHAHQFLLMFWTCFRWAFNRCCNAMMLQIIILLQQRCPYDSSDDDNDDGKLFSTCRSFAGWATCLILSPLDSKDWFVYYAVAILKLFQTLKYPSWKMMGRTSDLKTVTSDPSIVCKNIIKVWRFEDWEDAAFSYTKKFMKVWRFEVCKIRCFFCTKKVMKVWRFEDSKIGLPLAQKNHESLKIW